MNLNTRHKQSFLQLAKTFITFSGKNKNKERKTNEKEQKMHRTLRKTISLGSSGVDMKKEPDIWFDLNHDTNNETNKVFKETVFILLAYSFDINNAVCMLDLLK